VEDIVDGTRFDHLAKRLARGVSRRALLGGTAAVGAATLLGTTATAVQEASPVATPAVGQAEWLLVVNFEGAELAIPEDGRGMTITLTGVDGHVMAFTDRPTRDYHLTPLATAAAAINAAGDSDPLNATLVARPPLSRDSLDMVVVLRSATVDAANEHLVLETRVLGGPLLTTTLGRAPGEPTTLRGGSLFVDDADLTTVGSSSSCIEYGDECGADVQCCAGLVCQVTGTEQMAINGDWGPVEYIYTCLNPNSACASADSVCDESSCLYKPCCGAFECAVKPSGDDLQCTCTPVQGS
jgi:hypothetical protein